MSASPLTSLSDLQTNAKQFNAFKYTAVATLALIVYDYICTVEDEIRLVWPSRWSLIKCIYFLNRAIALVGSLLLAHLLLMITDGETCKRNLYAVALMAQMMFVVGEVVLLMRVYAIWSCDWRMMVFLVMVYVPGIVGATFAVVRATRTATSTSLPEIFGPGCLVLYSSTDFWICYLVLLFHETLMLLLILTKAFLAHRFNLSGILRMLVKDGILYYLCVLGTSVGNLLVLLLAAKNLRTFLIPTQGVLHSILCARLLLRLRGAYESLTSKERHLVHISNLAESTTLIDQTHPDAIPMHHFSSSPLSQGSQDTWRSSSAPSSR